MRLGKEMRSKQRKQHRSSLLPFASIVVFMHTDVVFLERPERPTSNTLLSPILLVNNTHAEQCMPSTVLLRDCVSDRCDGRSRVGMTVPGATALSSTRRLGGPWHGKRCSVRLWLRTMTVHFFAHFLSVWSCTMRS